MALLGGCGTVAYLVVKVLHGCPLSEKYSDCARSSGLFDWWPVEPSYSGVVGFRLRRTFPKREGCSWQIQDSGEARNLL